MFLLRRRGWPAELDSPRSVLKAIFAAGGVRASEQRAVIDQATAWQYCRAGWMERLAAMAGTQKGSDA